MKLKQLIAITFLTAFYLTIFLPLSAQDPPASTYQPGYWQPSARFDTKRQVEVQFVNETDMSLEYDLTNIEESNPQTLPSEESASIKNFGVSAYIVIYPQGEIDPNDPFTLKFEVNVNANNQVVVTIKKGERSFLGHRAVNLQKNGAIYLY